MAVSYMDAQNTITVTRGSSVTFRLSVKDDVGEPFDLTGTTVWFTVKSSLLDSHPLIQKRSVEVDQILIVDARQGEVEIYLRPPDTADMCTGKKIFDIWVVQGDDRYIVVGPTELKIVPSVTRIGG